MDIVIYAPMFIILYFVTMTLLFCLAVNTSDYMAKIGLSIAVRERCALFQ